ncbi:MAG: phosphoenolpyruvate synthase [Patescibacteria group bacterium]|nr:phosphoenolpyruvate synthase [Patescibacteria group bacterium]
MAKTKINKPQRNVVAPVYVKDFSVVNMTDVASVGGKNASLGEMFRNLGKRGIPVPDGFAVTADAYWRFMDATGLRQVIADALRGLDTRDVDALANAGGRVRQAILAAELPEDVRASITESYRQLGERIGTKEPAVAVRSSATAEDLPGASFAGQQDTYLNIKGEFALLDAVKRCIASLFTNRAIAYRVEKGFDHLKVALSVGVQKMVRSDLACAGVMFSIDTESGFENAVLINGAYGLGESVVQGKVNPDQYYVFKPTLKQGFRPIIGRTIGSKETKIVYSLESGAPIHSVPVPADERQQPCLNDDEVLQLAKWGVAIEEYYSKLVGHLEPMDIEWAKDGVTGQLFIVQARPETVQAGRDRHVLEEYVIKSKKAEVLVTGLSVGTRIGSGRVRVIRDIADMPRFKAGEVLVAEMTDPDWVPIMKKAAAIVTNSGGRTCHAAIVSREMGTPAVVGTREAMEKLKDGMEVTVSCAEGEEGKVYAGLIPFEVKRTKLDDFKTPKTAVMLNIAEPEMAFDHSFLPNAGVGLARAEFIFTNFIKIHPLALLNYDRLPDLHVKEAIDDLTIGYTDKTKFFVDRLAEGVGRLAAAFSPKEVILRFSDFKTNEYANLIGGKAYEPVESNPMIGWRGASRYYDPKYKEAFLLECRAIRKVREEMGLKNLVVMIPFCRTPQEGKDVLKAMAEAGLVRGKDGLKVYVMAEIPSNVILADQFADIFDGFSIGSNDLTQLTLGVDRDSSYVSHLYNERNDAIYESIRHLIRVAKKKHVKVGICGQAPSDYPEFAQFLVEEGIDSMSLNPDSVIKTSIAIAETEAKLARQRGGKAAAAKGKK